MVTSVAQFELRVSPGSEPSFIGVVLIESYLPAVVTCSSGDSNTWCVLSDLESYWWHIVGLLLAVAHCNT